jgi:hypothetical protein
MIIIREYMNLLEKLYDLLKQATTEHTHYYTASVIKEAIKYIEINESNNGTSNMSKVAIKAQLDIIQEANRNIRNLLS